MKHAVVTGANGFVGSAVVNNLVKHGYRVTALTHSGARSDNDLVKYLHYSFDSLGEVFSTVSRADVLFHFAWDGTSGASRSDLTLQLDNVKWTSDIVEQCSNLHSRFVGAGSIMEMEQAIMTGTNGFRMSTNSIYSSAKYISHSVSKAIAESLGVEHVWGIITNAYGPGENSPRLINSTIKKIISGEPLLFTNGTQIYDFIYIDDLANAFRLIGERGKPRSQYVLGSGKPHSLREYLETMHTTVAPNSVFEYGAIPDSGVSLSYSDYSTEETYNDTGFTAKTTFETGIKKTFEWYMVN